MGYTEQEKFDILQFYIKCNKNKRLAKERYQREYRNRQTPTENTFVNVFKQLQYFKTLQRKKAYRGVDENTELNVLLYFQGKILT